MSEPIHQGRGLFGRLEPWVAFTLFAGTFAFGFDRLHYGLGERDESFYLATSMRYALGDLPFRDEIFNPARMYDVLLAPFFWAFPDLGLRGLRIGWLVVELLTAALLFRLLRRYASDSVVALSCCAVVFVPNLMWTPAYHVMGTFGFVLSLVIWLEGCLSGSTGRACVAGIVSGIVFFLGAVSYVPLLAVGIVPFVVFCLEVWQRNFDSARFVSTSAHLATVGTLAGTGVAAILGAGLGPDWLNAQSRLSEVYLYSLTPIEKLGVFGHEISSILWTVLGTVGAVVALSVLWRRAERLPGSAVWVVACAAAALLALGIRYCLFWAAPSDAIAPLYWSVATLPMRLFGLSVGALLAAFALQRCYSRATPTIARTVSEWTFVSAVLVSGSLVFGFLQGYLSGQTFKVMFCVVPLFPVAIVQLVHVLGSSGSTTARIGSQVCALAVAGSVVVAVFQHRNGIIYHSRPRQMLDTEFEHPRLRGIVERRDLVKRMQAVDRVLRQWVDPGDYLLAYDDAPLVYFMTNTRPALDHAWTYAGLPGDMRRRSIERMIELERIPEIAVQDLRDKEPGAFARNPVHAFVRKHYRVLRDVRGFRIWRLDERRWPPRHGRRKS